MPKRSEKFLAERKLELASAAMRCFNRKGFHATSIPDICEEAGVSIGTLYKYFDGKHGMWMTALEQNFDNGKPFEQCQTWTEFRDLMIGELPSVDDSESLGYLAGVLEISADALRDRQLTDRGALQAQKTHKYLTAQLLRFKRAGEISLPLGAEVSERTIRSIVLGAKTQYYLESLVPKRTFKKDIVRTLNYLVGAVESSANN